MASGNVANEPVVWLTEPMELDCALNPEAVLDYNEASNAALCIKSPLSMPEMVHEDYFDFFQRLNIKEAMVKNVLGTYGAGKHIKMLPVHFAQGELGSTREPFRVNINFSDPEKQALLREYGLDKWLQVRGVLPAIRPDWNGISFPKGTVFGKRTCEGLSMQLGKFGCLHVLITGIERWVVIPRDKNDTINNVIRDHLRGNGCPENLLECPQFLQHAEFFFDEDYLVRNFGAEAFDLVGGECLFLQAGIYAQVTTTCGGFCISSDCVPKTWLELNALAGCEHAKKGLHDRDIAAIRRVAVGAKDNAATFLKLASIRQEDPPQVNISNIQLAVPMVSVVNRAQNVGNVKVQDEPQQSQ